MQIQANPWSFVGPADQAQSQPIASITNQGRSALVTTAGAHGLSVGQLISIQGVTKPDGTVSEYCGAYTILSVPSTTTLVIQAEIFLALPNKGAGGNVLTAVYAGNIRAEQILWDNMSPGDVLMLTDVAGNLVYELRADLTATAGPYTYGKLFWIHGLVLNSLPSGIVQITIN